MAKQVYADSESIRHFAGDLKNFRSRVNEITNRLQGNLSRLSDSWQDQEFDNFAHAFVATQQILLRFSDEVEKTLPNLERDAARTEEIHNPKVPNL